MEQVPTCFYFNFHWLNWLLLGVGKVRQLFIDRIIEDLLLVVVIY